MFLRLRFPKQNVQALVFGSDFLFLMCDASILKNLKITLVVAEEKKLVTVTTTKNLQLQSGDVPPANLDGDQAPNSKEGSDH